VTDANLLLGRLIPEYFPKIFGKSEHEPLDVDTSRGEFERLAQNINENSPNEFTLDEIIYGCVSYNTQNFISEYA
jgi:5-oxoprolinase (ATP-hydrolysing)